MSKDNTKSADGGQAVDDQRLVRHGAVLARRWNATIERDGGGYYAKRLEFGSEVTEGAARAKVEIMFRGDRVFKMVPE